VLVGFAPPQALCLSRALEDRGARVMRVDTAREALAALAARDVAVLCLGPALGGAAAVDFLRRAADARKADRCRSLVLAAGRDLSPFQELVNDDELYYLTREPPAGEVILELLVAALRTDRRGTPVTTSRRRREVELRRTVMELSRDLARADEPAEAADCIARAARTLVDADGARCVLYDPRSQTFSQQGRPRLDDERLADERGDSIAAGLVGYAIRTGRPLRVERVGEDARWDREADTPGGGPDDRFLALPLTTAAGAAGGQSDPPRGGAWAVLTLSRGPTAAPFSAAELDDLRFLARRVAPLVGLFSLRDELQELLAAGDAAGDDGSPPLFRRRAVDYHANGSRRGKGRPLEVSPAWRWTSTPAARRWCAPTVGPTSPPASPARWPRWWWSRASRWRPASSCCASTATTRRRSWRAPRASWSSPWPSACAIPRTAAPR
jgi:hypothetical protein